MNLPQVKATIGLLDHIRPVLDGPFFRVTRHVHLQIHGRDRFPDRQWNRQLVLRIVIFRRHHEIKDEQMIPRLQHSQQVPDNLPHILVGPVMQNRLEQEDIRGTTLRLKEIVCLERDAGCTRRGADIRLKGRLGRGEILDDQIELGIVFSEDDADMSCRPSKLYCISTANVQFTLSPEPLATARTYIHNSSPLPQPTPIKPPQHPLRHHPTRLAQSLHRLRKPLRAKPPRLLRQPLEVLQKLPQIRTPLPPIMIRRQRDRARRDLLRHLRPMPPHKPLLQRIHPHRRGGPHILQVMREEGPRIGIARHVRGRGGVHDPLPFLGEDEDGEGEPKEAAHDRFGEVGGAGDVGVAGGAVEGHCVPEVEGVEDVEGEEGVVWLFGLGSICLCHLIEGGQGDLQTCSVGTRSRWILSLDGAGFQESLGASCENPGFWGLGAWRLVHLLRRMAAVAPRR